VSRVPQVLHALYLLGKHPRPHPCTTISGPYTKIIFRSEMTNPIYRSNNTCSRSNGSLFARRTRVVNSSPAPNCHLESPFAQIPTPLRTIHNHCSTPTYPLSPLYFSTGTSSISGIRQIDRSELLPWRHWRLRDDSSKSGEERSLASLGRLRRGGRRIAGVEWVD
jgi:hypothetical protein